jgi:prepilin-type N-terminal cleavage/methylation domain-containing protein
MLYAPVTCHARQRAFTLIELLLVIVIIGVLTAIVAPQFSAGIGGTRLQVEARAIAQAERYARTMALLHQTEVDLFIDTNHLMRVDAAPQAAEDRGGGSGEDERRSGVAPGPTASPFQPTVTNRSMRSTGTESGGSDEDGAPLMMLPAALATSEAFAGAIHVEHRFDRVVVRFLGYTDSEVGLSDIGNVATPSEGDEPVRIRFRSNGTCRPHRFRLEDSSGAALEVQIDVLGAAKIDER